MIGILIPLGAVLIAILIIAALWLWWSGNEAAPVSEGSDTGGTLMNNIVAMPASQPAPLIQQPPPNEMLRVIRNNDGSLGVMINGATYHNMAEISRDPAMTDYFMKTLRSLAKFAQDADGIDAPMQQNAPSPIEGVPAYQPAAPAPSFTAAPVRTEPPAKPEIQEADGVPTTMAGQIEVILQERLLRTPGMQGRAIHIYSSSGGGVTISVDNDVFESVGDITDPDARAAIEAAIRDWEVTHPI